MYEITLNKSCIREIKKVLGLFPKSCHSGEVGFSLTENMFKIYVKYDETLINFEISYPVIPMNTGDNVNAILKSGGAIKWSILFNTFKGVVKHWKDVDKIVIKISKDIVTIGNIDCKNLETPEVFDKVVQQLPILDLQWTNFATGEKLFFKPLFNFRMRIEQLLKLFDTAKHFYNKDIGQHFLQSVGIKIKGDYLKFVTTDGVCLNKVTAYAHSHLKYSDDDRYFAIPFSAIEKIEKFLSLVDTWRDVMVKVYEGWLNLSVPSQELDIHICIKAKPYPNVESGFEKTFGDSYKVFAGALRDICQDFADNENSENPVLLKIENDGDLSTLILDSTKYSESPLIRSMSVERVQNTSLVFDSVLINANHLLQALQEAENTKVTLTMPKTFLADNMLNVVYVTYDKSKTVDSCVVDYITGFRPMKISCKTPNKPVQCNLAIFPMKDNPL